MQILNQRGQKILGDHSLIGSIEQSTDNPADLTKHAKQDAPSFSEGDIRINLDI